MKRETIKRLETLENRKPRGGGVEIWTLDAAGLYALSGSNKVFTQAGFDAWAAKYPEMVRIIDDIPRPKGC